jgi:hypothetical protein
MPQVSTKPEKGLGDKQRLVLSILKRLIVEHERNLAQGGRDTKAAKVELSDWRKAAKEDGLDIRNFSRWTAALEDRRLITNDGIFVSLADSSHSSPSSFEENKETSVIPHSPHSPLGMRGVRNEATGKDEEGDYEEF